MTWPSHRTLLLIAALVVGGMLVAGGGWFWYASAQHQGAAAYAEAMSKVQASYAAQASPDIRDAAVKELERALQQYPSSAMAAQGALELGNLRYNLRQYPQARAAWEIAVARAGSRTIRTLARSGIAASWEAERNFPQAVDAYRAALSGLGPKEFLYDQLLMDLGRSQELAGRKAEAVETYRRVVKELPKTMRADEARARLADLGVAS